MDYKKLCQNLKRLEVIAYGYNINGEVLGMDYSDFEQIMADGVDAIQQLILRAEKAERERDVAVNQLRGDCEKCVHFKVTWNGCTPDFECPLSDRCLNRDLWEWNGGQKEE